MSWAGLGILTVAKLGIEMDIPSTHELHSMEVVAHFNEEVHSHVPNVLMIKPTPRSDHKYVRYHTHACSHLSPL